MRDCQVERVVVSYDSSLTRLTSMYACTLHLKEKKETDQALSQVALFNIDRICCTHPSK